MCLSWTNKGFDVINKHGTTMKAMKICYVTYNVIPNLLKSLYLSDVAEH